MSTYIALTTTNAQMMGWEFLGAAPTREDAEKFRPELRPNDYGNLDIYDETRVVNFRVVSKTRAREYLGRRGAELAAKGIDPAASAW